MYYYCCCHLYDDENYYLMKNYLNPNFENFVHFPPFDDLIRARRAAFKKWKKYSKIKRENIQKKGQTFQGKREKVKSVFISEYRIYIWMHHDNNYTNVF